jgi:aromatic ring-opening dioxygenase catalytic subunit (LigB family)
VAVLNFLYNSGVDPRVVKIGLSSPSSLFDTLAHSARTIPGAVGQKEAILSSGRATRNLQALAAFEDIWLSGC